MEQLDKLYRLKGRGCYPSTTCMIVLNGDYPGLSSISGGKHTHSNRIDRLFALILRLCLGCLWTIGPADGVSTYAVAHLQLDPMNTDWDMPTPFRSPDLPFFSCPPRFLTKTYVHPILGCFALTPPFH